MEKYRCVTCISVDLVLIEVFFVWVFIASFLYIFLPFLWAFLLFSWFLIRIFIIIFWILFFPSSFLTCFFNGFFLLPVIFRVWFFVGITVTVIRITLFIAVARFLLFPFFAFFLKLFLALFLGLFFLLSFFQSFWIEVLSFDLRFLFAIFFLRRVIRFLTLVLWATSIIGILLAFTLGLNLFFLFVFGILSRFQFLHFGIFVLQISFWIAAIFLDWVGQPRTFWIFRVLGCWLFFAYFLLRRWIFVFGRF